MWKQIWRWLKQTFQNWVNKLFYRQEGLRQQETSSPGNDAQYERLLFQLLDGVEAGWTEEKVHSYREYYEDPKFTNWLERFGNRVVTAPVPDRELGRRIVHLSNVADGQLGTWAKAIGGELQGASDGMGGNYKHHKEAQEWFKKGQEELQSKNYQEALDSFNKAVELDPNYYQAWLKRGWILYLMKQGIEAISSFDKAIEIDAGDREAWAGRGHCFLTIMKDYQQAIANFDKSIEVDPSNSAFCWYCRGLAYLELENDDDALISFDKYVELDPDAVKGWTERAFILSRKQQYKEAINSFNKAIDIDSDGHRPWIGLLGVIDDLLEIEPSAYQIWTERGNLLVNLPGIAAVVYDQAFGVETDEEGDKIRHKQAFDSFNKAIEINPNFHKAWYERGRLFFKQEKYEEALSDFTKATEANPDSALSWFLQASAFNKLERYEEELASTG